VWLCVSVCLSVCVCVIYVICFPTCPFFFFFSYLSPPLLIPSFENRPVLFPGQRRKRRLNLSLVFLCLFCVVVHYFSLVNEAWNETVNGDAVLFWFNASDETGFCWHFDTYLTFFIMSPGVTVKRWTYDNAQRHLTAFRPISEAAHSWSCDNLCCIVFCRRLCVYILGCSSSTGSMECASVR